MADPQQATGWSVPVPVPPSTGSDGWGSPVTVNGQSTQNANAIPAGAGASPSWIDQAKEGVSRLFSNFNPMNAIPAVSHAILHPLDTMSAQGQETIRIAHDAAAAFKQGDYVTGISKALDAAANAVPFVPLGSQIDRSQTEMAQGHYGVGLADAGTAGLTAAGAARGAMGSGVAPALGTADAIAGGAIDPATMVRGSGDRPWEPAPSVSSALSDDAVAKSIMPGSGPNRGRFSQLAQKVAPYLNANDLATGDLDTTAQNVGQALSDAKTGYQQAEASIPAGRMMTTAPVLARLQAARDALNVPTTKISTFAGGAADQLRAAGQDRMADAADAGKSFSEQIGQSGAVIGTQAQAALLDKSIAQVQQLGDAGSMQSWRTIRSGLDSIADQAKLYAPDAASIGAKQEGIAARNAAGILRDSMAQAFPEMSNANAAYSALTKAQDVIDAAKQAQFLTATKTGATAALSATPGIVGKVALALAQSTTLPGRLRLIGELSNAINTGQLSNVVSSTMKGAAALGLKGAQLDALGALLNPNTGGSK